MISVCKLFECLKHVAKQSSPHFPGGILYTFSVCNLRNFCSSLTEVETPADNKPALLQITIGTKPIMVSFTEEFVCHLTSMIQLVPNRRKPQRTPTTNLIHITIPQPVKGFSGHTKSRNIVAITPCLSLVSENKILYVSYIPTPPAGGKSNNISFIFNITQFERLPQKW